ncbi:ribonuclease H-like domain-containing protein [Tanacetum coccineum]
MTRKYCLELFHEYGLLAARPVSIPLPENSVLNHVESIDDKFLNNISNYQKLVGKLIYLTNTRPDISYAVHCLSQHIHCPLQSHIKYAFRVLRYLKSSPGKSLMTCKSKKQVTLYRSSTKAEYRIDLHCDNSYAIQLAANPVFHEKFKHFEINVHFVREKVTGGVIKTIKVYMDFQARKVLNKKSLTFSLKEGVQESKSKSSQTKCGGLKLTEAERCKVTASSDKLLKTRDLTGTCAYIS